MLSTTVEPECRQRPFVVSYAMTGAGSGEAAATEDAAVRDMPKTLVHNTIHPAVDRVEAYGTTARTISPAVH